VTKKEPGKKPGEVTQDEALTRRMAIKRIAAGLTGAGIVVVAGIICQRRPYGDSVKLPYQDKAPSR
jgi:hypothetical protein